MKETLKILHIEDNPGDAFLLQSLLNDSAEYSFEIINVTTVKSALQQLNGVFFDVIFMDLGLPDNEGLQKLPSILDASADSVLFVLTGFQANQLGRQSLKMGAMDYLTKDQLNTDYLIKTIEFGLERKQEKFKLIKSEEKYRILTNSLRQILWQTDADSNLTFINPYGMEYFNLPYEQMKDQRWLDLIHPDSRSDIKNKIYSTFNKGDSFSFECQMKATHGLYRWCKMSASILLDEIGEKVGLLGIIVDIHLEKTLQKDLEDSESFLQTIFNESPTAIMVADDDGNYYRANKAAANLMGCSLEELLNSNVRNFESKSEQEISEMHASYLENTKATGEFHFVNNHNENKIAIYHSARLRENMNISMMLDMTTALNYYYEKEANEKRLSRAQEVGQIGDWELNLKTREVFWSKSLFTIFDRNTDLGPPDETSFIQEFNPKEQETLRNYIQYLSDHMGSTVEFYSKIKSSEQYKYLKHTLTSEISEYNKSARIICVVQDVTNEMIVKEELLEANRTLSMARDSASLAVWDWQIQDGYLNWDSAMNKLYENESSKPITSFEQWSQYIHPDDQDRIEKILLGAVRNPQSPVNNYLEFKIITGNKSIKHVRSTFQVLRNAQGKGVRAIGLNWDASDQVNQIKQINQLSMVAKETSNSAVITDCDGKIVWINKAFERITGYSMEEAKNQFPGKLLQGPKSDPEIVRKMNKAIKNMKPFHVEIINYTKSKEEFWIDIQCQPLFDENGNYEGFFALQTDITERKKLELQMELNNRRLQTIIDNTPGLILILLPDDDLSIIYASNYFKTIVGYDHERFKPFGKYALSSLLDPNDQELNQRVLRDAFESKKRFSINLKITTKEGQRRWLQSRGEFQVYDKPFEECHYISVIFDITDQVVEEERLLNAAHNGADEERRRISMDIHDSLQQTMVTSLINFESIKESVPNDLQERFNTGVHYLRNSINETRTIAHKLMPKAVDDFGLTSSLRALIDDLGSKVQIEITDNLNGKRLPKSVELGLYRITQEAINNILKHAEASEASIQIMRYNKLIQLSIEDNGKGFSTEINNPKNSTFGLAAIKSRATALGGEVEINSSPGKGTSIHIFI